MQFNPTDKSDSLIGDIDFLLFGDSSTLNTKYSLTDRTRNINISYDEAVALMYRADPMYKWDDYTRTDIPIATLDLSSGADHYDLLDEAQVIHRVRMKDENGNFQTLEPVERRELSDTELRTTYTGTPSKYYKMGGVIFPIPIPDYGASDGVEIEFQRTGNHFETSDTTAKPGFNSQFHQFLSVSASLRYAIANGMKEKVVVLTQQKQQIADAMREFYERRSPDEKPSFSLKRRNVRAKYGL